MQREEATNSESEQPATKQHVVIASTNPVKVNAAKAAFLKCFPTTAFEFTSVEVATGVSTQPMTDLETETGIRLRRDSIAVRFIPFYYDALLRLRRRESCSQCDGQIA
jgi:hypothetical protein